MNKRNHRRGLAELAVDYFVGWVIANPKLALSLAFEVGKLAANMTKNPRKASSALRTAVVRALPHPLPDPIVGMFMPSALSEPKRKPKPARKKRR